MLARPVLVGMCDPGSGDPRRALGADRHCSAGWRAWQLLRSHPGMGKVTAEEYEAALERRNVLESREWDAREARLAAPRLLEKLRGRVVLVLGTQALAALGLGRPETGSWQAGEMTWAWLPHPSGRCRWYNDDGHKRHAAKVLADLYRRGRAACLTQ